MWLGIRERLWTAARRQRHGLQDSADCTFCDQELETFEHLFAKCNYTQQVWHYVSSMLNLQNSAPAQNATLTEWWLQKRESLSSAHRKGLDSILYFYARLMATMEGTQRSRVFEHATAKNPEELYRAILQEATLWSAAGARCLASFSWPASLSH